MKGLTPQKRGPKSKHHPLQEENAGLRSENQRLAEEHCKAEIVIDVQNKWVSHWGGHCSDVGPQGKPP